MKTKEEYVTIKQLYHQGYNITQIARTLGINRKTVRKYLRHDRYPGYRNQHRKSQLERYRHYLESRLKTYPSLSSIRLYHELRQKGYTSGYRMLCKFVQRIRPPQPAKAYIRVETSPGKQAQADWAEFPQVQFPDATADVHCFVITLSYSRNLFIEFCLDEKEQALQNCHIHAFEYFGGIPLEIRYDNMPTIVLRRVQGKPVFHTGFRDFAAFYKFKPDICHPGHKEAKGKAERVIRYIRENFFYARTFRDLDDLNAQARVWLDTTANHRFNKLHGAHVSDLLKEEKLQSLPRFRYDTRIPHVHKVTKDCLTSYQGNFYSVPHQYAHHTVELHDDGAHIYCYVGGHLVAQHKKCVLKKGQMVINPRHYEGLRNHNRYVQLVTQSQVVLTSPQPSPHDFDWLLAKYPGYTEEVEKRDLALYEKVCHG